MVERPLAYHLSTGLAVRCDGQTLEFHPLVPYQGRDLFLSLMADGGVYEFEPSASRVRRRDSVAAHDLSFSDNPREQFRFEPAVQHSESQVEAA
jgi:hypothetical protein